MYGVIIEKGPQDYQILQQENGFAKINLVGKVEISDDIKQKKPCVMVRLLDENSEVDMIPPVKTEISNDKWSVSFFAPLGGMYTLRTYVRYGEREMIRGNIISHIGVGDLYLIAGQSNAEGNGKNSAYDPICEKVHMLKLSGKWDIASHPLSDNTNSKYKRYSNVGYHTPWLQFAKIINAKVGYPIGLLPSAQGGIPLSYWDKDENGELFDDMMDIVKTAGGKIKGILWYQGCTDIGNDYNRNNYLERFKKVCRNIRTTLNNNVPFLTVQLNKTTYFGSNDREVSAENWAILREAQRKAMHEIENVYMVPSIDMTVCDTIHNSSFSNLVIGERLANVALHYMYGKSILCDAPDIKRAYLKDTKTICLEFDNVCDAIATDYYFAEALPFVLKDENGKHYIKDYTCNGDNTILLHFEKDVVLPATISCMKYSESGFMPYDLVTRLPVIPFYGIAVD